jgi:signal transduction histidine kinase/CheY-like chemotaxis protein
MPPFEAFPRAPDDQGDGGVAALARSIGAAIATGKAQLMPAQHYPIEMHQDGRSWFKDMYWSATNTPVYDADGKLVCISHTTIDVTAEVLAQQALEAAREDAERSARTAEENRSYLAGVLRSAPVGIMMVNTGARLLHSNLANESLFGSDITDSGGRVDFRQWKGWFGDGEHAGRQLAPEDWPLYRALAGDTVDKCLLEVESFTPGHPRRILLVSAAPLIDAGGVLVGATAAAMDIADRVRAEQGLIEADRRKDEFLAMLAHELRNPLAPIGAAAALLAMGDRDEEHVRRTSAVITRQVQHMSGLIDELLDVARVTRGLVVLDKAALDAKRIVAEAVEQVRPVLEARRHTLKVSQPPMSAFVEGDRKRLVQVVANLLNNAAKFTPEGGVIQIELVIDAHHVRISISDNGIGMAPDIIGRVFDLFVQAERTSDRKQGGLGIGLALVRSLVGLHDGSVSAHSDGPGCGSRFTVCLKKLERGPDALAASAAHHGVQAQGATLTILIVDDNEDALMVLDMLIGSLGHRIVSLSSSREALQRAVELRPDVCLLDIGLPDIDGLTLARALRADPRTRDATLIAMSGYGQATDIDAGLAAGFDEYHVKPVDIARLTATLAHLAPRIEPVLNRNMINRFGERSDLP